MALLTAEDVLNKAFSKTKYREGFDQDEVDDFLDEVANTIAQLTAERDEFAARLANGAAPAPVVEAPPVTSAGGVPGTTGLLAAATDPGATNPTGMLAMAQKLHDEYVQAGEAERDRIIDEAHAAADQVRERAEADANSRMDELAGERAGLEARIDDLRRFERDYRARLRQYLENLLGDLDHTATGAASATGAAAGLAALSGDDFGSAGEPEEAAPEAPAEEAAPEFTPQDAVEVEEAEVLVVEEFEPEPIVPFEEAVGGFGPDAGSGEQAAAAPEPVDAPPAVPAYDPNQSWESQLGANPFAPVSQPAPAQADQEQTDAAAVPPVEASESEEAPYTPPSSRMFNDLYGQQRPESQN